MRSVSLTKRNANNRSIIERSFEIQNSSPSRRKKASILDQNSSLTRRNKGSIADISIIGQCKSIASSMVRITPDGEFKKKLEEKPPNSTYMKLMEKIKKGTDWKNNISVLHEGKVVLLKKNNLILRNDKVLKVIWCRCIFLVWGYMKCTDRKKNRDGRLIFSEYWYFCFDNNLVYYFIRMNYYFFPFKNEIFQKKTGFIIEILFLLRF